MCTHTLSLRNTLVTWHQAFYSESCPPNREWGPGRKVKFGGFESCRMSSRTCRDDRHWPSLAETLRRWLPHWLPGHLTGAWLPDRCLAAWLPGCLDAWLPGCLAAWLPGCLAAWMPGCLVAWLPGCLAAWLPGCLAA